jgi:protein O-GlcNAc transferase
MPPATDPRNPAKLLLNASKALDLGKLTLAEVLARDALDRQPENPRAHYIIARVAEVIGRPDLAATHYQTSLSAGPNSDARKRCKALPADLAPPQAPEPGARGYFLIKPWGAGFWSDVNHVLGQLLLAEIEGRTPVVLWGRGSLYRDPDTANAWDSLFEPVSDAALADIAREQHDFYPPKWDAANLDTAECDKWEGRGSRLGLELLGRPERVVVSDFNLRLFTLLPWIPEWHSLHGQKVESVYRDFAARYLRPRADILAPVDQFAAEHFDGHTVLGVHVRATDKVVEDPRLPQINAEYFPRVDRYLESNPGGRIFLLTDGQSVLASFNARYPGRVIATESIRSDSQTGIHFQTQHKRSTIAREVLTDVLLATRCDAFLGFGNSSVSTFVYHLKDWNAEACTLLGGVINHHGRNSYIYMTNRIPRGA